MRGWAWWSENAPGPAASWPHRRRPASARFGHIARRGVYPRSGEKSPRHGGGRGAGPTPRASLRQDLAADHPDLDRPGPILRASPEVPAEIPALHMVTVAVRTGRRGLGQGRSGQRSASGSNDQRSFHHQCSLLDLGVHAHGRSRASSGQCGNCEAHADTLLMGAQGNAQSGQPFAERR